MGGLVSKGVGALFSERDRGPGWSEVDRSRTDRVYTPDALAQQVIDEENARQKQSGIDKRRGFMESIGGWGSNAGKLARPGMASMAAAPPPQWAYVQGQGPVWQTPERIGSSTNYQMVNNAPGTPGFYGGGNRI